jgi:hypothetical protein
MVGDTLHCRDDNNDARVLDSGVNQTGGMRHALRAKQRAAAKFQGHDPRLRALRLFASCDRKTAFFVGDRKAVLFTCNREAVGYMASGGHIFLHVFGTHDFRS